MTHIHTKRLPCAAAISLPALLGLVLMAGCQPQPAPPPRPPMGGPGGMMGGPGGPGGFRGGPGRFRGGPGGGANLAANASGPEIYGQMCQNCHGDKGQGTTGPALASAGKESDTELQQIIHDGRRRMPSFAGRLTDAQIKTVAAYVKQLAAGK